MSTPDYSFCFRHVDVANCGQHDMYNGFLAEEGLAKQFADWQEENPGAIPVGVCPENQHNIGKVCGEFIAMVFEDEEGRRFFVHVPAYWVDEAKVANRGERAMEDARWLRLFGRSKSSFEDRMKGKDGQG